MNGRGKFYFSAEQRKRGRGSNTIALLDDGRKVEYTEMSSFTPEEEEEFKRNYPDLREHAERFKDSVYLGEGRIYSINGIVQGKFDETDEVPA